eukprot:CAMPEP_0203884054 /NCGR_PEP_ID=MMETSP0359-20131031/28120_1 /ASSEMBLY_ACC=CAM_ASM_000338 /TAXON_ID=268821 /ORGANISM="Scrippsiella Hangoei, Strain SHTV-5" /LENGTH=74 /DNA_ID=CAMNT_0050804423 /DNA_START=82 /DNA_END=303 /DNA_ORIENTATION=-
MRGCARTTTSCIRGKASSAPKHGSVSEVVPHATAAACSLCSRKQAAPVTAAKARAISASMSLGERCTSKLRRNL